MFILFPFSFFNSFLQLMIIYTGITHKNIIEIKIILLYILQDQILGINNDKTNKICKTVINKFTFVFLFAVLQDFFIASSDNISSFTVYNI